MTTSRTPSRRLVRVALGGGLAVATTVTVAVVLPGASSPVAAAGLQDYSSCDALSRSYRAALQAQVTPYGVGDGGGFGRDMLATTGSAAAGAAESRAGAPVAQAAQPQADAGGAVGTGTTGTNLQEQGVDEPDVAKVRGELLVTVAGSTLRVLRTGDAPALLGSVAVLPPDTYGGEVLLVGDRALVTASTYRTTKTAQGETSTPLAVAVLVDLTDPAAPKVLESLELEGAYLSARLVGDRVRLVTGSAPQVVATYPRNDSQTAREDAQAANARAVSRLRATDLLPTAVRRGADKQVLGSGPAVACTDVAYPQEQEGARTIVVTTLDPGRGLAPLDTVGVQAPGDLVYASATRLYVATTRYEGGDTPTVGGGIEPAVDVMPGAPATDDAPAPTAPQDAPRVFTQVHAFDTDGPSTRYVGSGEVDGTVLGRWAFSEHEGRLRVAVTSAPQDGEAATESSLVVLAEEGQQLRQVGRVDGMGKGERIYAVRYFGDVAAVVTFRQVDPLYLLDLSDPAAPRVTGELKIPGFSTYLHPIGNGLLLGLGMDADPKSGRTTGMQLSTFRISDPSAPTQVDRLSLGPAWSPASDDSRAFGYDPVSRLAVLPFQAQPEFGGEVPMPEPVPVEDGASTSGGSTGSAGDDVVTIQPAPDARPYQQPAWQALGVRVSADGQLTEAGRLAVGAQEQLTRVLRDAGHVYAVSDRAVTAGRATDLGRTGRAGW